MNTSVRSFIVFFSMICLGFAFAQNDPISLQVDATDAPRQILHSRLRIPAKPGPVTLLFPKWIPGEHGPTGPINDLVNLKISAGGKSIEWRRDAVEMYAFQFQVPNNADALDVSFDFLLPFNSGEFSSGGSATAQLLDLSWNHVLLYPKGAKAATLQYQANLRLPPGWNFGTALSIASQTPDQIEFASVSLETLVDSPLIAGKYFRTVDLTPGAKPAHFLHIVADSAAAIEIKPDESAAFSRLVKEANGLFGARHYRNYHFLLTLSEHVAHFGLEHHECSDNRTGEKYLTDDDEWKLGAFLLPHEMVHSWNGKYRRPFGLATDDFQQPMKSEMLWVYEGLTDYLGEVLAARSGMWTNASFREDFAQTGAMLDHQAGRKWRPLADTTLAAQLLYQARAEGTTRRRGVDFYPEGDLIWLEVDVLIREKSQGRYSLDDFCKKFFGGESGSPKVIPYSYDDVIGALNEIVTYDWREFFQNRVYAVNERAPLGGIEGSGWRLAYTNTLSDFLKAREGARKTTDLSYSLGLIVKEDGIVVDVIPESPADKAGVGPGMKLTAINGRRWKAENLRVAVKTAKSSELPIELLVENNEYFKTCKIDYHEGEKYPYLQRDESKPDLLTQILKPKNAEPVTIEKKE